MISPSVLVIGDQRGVVAIGQGLFLRRLDEWSEVIEQVALREAHPPLVARLRDRLGEVLEEGLLQGDPGDRPAAHPLQALRLQGLAPGLSLPLLVPIFRDDADRLVHRIPAGRRAGQHCLAAVEELGPRADQVREQQDRLIGAAVHVAELTGEHEGVMATLEGRRPVDAADHPSGRGARPEGEGGLCDPRHASRDALDGLVTESLGIAVISGERLANIVRADRAQLVRPDRSRGGRHGGEQAPGGAVVEVEAVQQAGQRRALEAGCRQHLLAFRRAGEAIEQGQEVADRPLATARCVEGQAGAEQVLEVFDLIPMRARRRRRRPLLKAEVDRLVSRLLAQIVVDPRRADVQVRVQVGEALDQW